ncbi:MAG: GMC family oxidoreductase [Hyphomonadaceae bacterium]|nr:GMC family oxidoreductase [Hyphomonadaceae bacterium]
MQNLSDGSRAARTFDAIVVGSGISGGWAAKELTEKGLKTLVLERGPQVKHVEGYKTFAMNPWDFRFAGGRTPQEEIDKHYPKQSRTGYTINDQWKHFFVKDDEHPYTEVKRFDWMRGYQVGGRSLTWARQSYRHSDLDFEANAKEGVGVDWPIRYADLAPWYSHVEKWIGVSGQTEGLPQLPDGDFQPPMEMNVVEKDLKAKVEGKFAERTVTIGRAAHLTKPTDEQMKLGRGTCQSRNLCMRGCAFGAYFSSNAATLVAAANTGNMTLQPDSVVTAILFDRTANKATGVRVLDATTKVETEYYAKVIFLCASALNTTWIMMNSKSDRFPEGFGNDSDELGRNVMDHHFLVGAQADVEGHEDRYYAGRRPNGIYIPRFRNLGDAATKQKDFTRGYGYQGGASRSGWQRLVGEMGFGKELKDEIEQPGDWTIGITAFGEILPYRDNRVTLNNDLKDIHGLPTLTMDVTIRENEMNMRKDMQTAGMEMLEAAGFKNVKGFDRTYAPGLGIHEMGTARMGRDPKTSVLNAYSQVHACKNVYVTDGAAMTSASCVNPSLTYMALTARAADHAVNALKRGEL